VRLKYGAYPVRLISYDCKYVAHRQCKYVVILWEVDKTAQVLHLPFLNPNPGAAIKNDIVVQLENAYDFQATDKKEVGFSSCSSHNKRLQYLT
jgi:hypothetical protein